MRGKAVCSFLHQENNSGNTSWTQQSNLRIEVFSFSMRGKHMVEIKDPWLPEAQSKDCGVRAGTCERKADTEWRSSGMWTPFTWNKTENKWELPVGKEGWMSPRDSWETGSPKTARLILVFLLLCQQRVPDFCCLQDPVLCAKTTRDRKAQSLALEHTGKKPGIQQGLMEQ